MKTIEHFIPNHDGWHLSLFQTWDEQNLVKERNPVLIVPGYGMNSYIFSYHPRGLSLEGYLAQAGHEVWRIDLRGQGRSVSLGGRPDYGLDDLALTDLDVAVRAALERTHTSAERADVIGASLGGTIVFIHAALSPKSRLGAIVAMGTPVRWVDVHPLVQVAFGSPTLVGMVRLRGTRKLAGFALPHLVRHTPWVLSLYMNAATIDASAASEMVKTVEDPSPYINREIAHWIRQRDLTVRGINVSRALASVENPLLCVLAKDDGIVPRRTAEFPYFAVRSKEKRLLEVSREGTAIAHADLFVAEGAQERVFAPITAWLAEQRALSRGATSRRRDS